MENASDHAILFATEENTPPPAANWYLPLFAVVVTLFAVYWGFVRPTSRQLTKMRRYVTSLEQSIADLNGQREGTAAATNLLEQLVRQQQSTRRATASLGAINELHNRIVRSTKELQERALILNQDSAQARLAINELDSLKQRMVDRIQMLDEAMPVLDRIDSLHSEVASSSATASTLFELIAHQQQTADKAKTAIGQIGTLHRQVIEEADQLPSARHALNKLAELRSEVSNQTPAIDATSRAFGTLHDLCQHLYRAAGDTEEALAAVDQLTAVRDGLVDGIQRLQEASPIIGQIEQLHTRLTSSTDQLQSARIATENLLALEEDLLIRATETDLAQDALDELIELQDRVEAQGPETAKASMTLEGLVSLQDSVLAESENVVVAIETLELSSDVQARLQESNSTLRGVQQMLVDMLIMKPTLEQAIAGLKPLSELTNLRRLNVTDLRQVAEVVMQRQTAVSDGRTHEVVADAHDTTVK